MHGWDCQPLLLPAHHLQLHAQPTYSGHCHLEYEHDTRLNMWMRSCLRIANSKLDKELAHQQGLPANAVPQNLGPFPRTARFQGSLSLHPCRAPGHPKAKIDVSNVVH